jgi:pSer/pThr/pTyr-binding forkhead associated (FHA) protein
MFLITNLGSGESQLLLQPQGVWTIGRNRDAAISLQDPMLSRRHAVIQYGQDGTFFLVDLNSMNGTFVNGSKVQHRHALQDGDVILMGNVAFTFFVSCKVRSLPAIHPEVLTRLNTAEPRSLAFIDYLAFE